MERLDFEINYFKAVDNNHQLAGISEEDVCSQQKASN